MVESESTPQSNSSTWMTALNADGSVSLEYIVKLVKAAYDNYYKDREDKEC